MNLPFFLSRAGRAGWHRLNPRAALRCALQRNRRVVKFTGIANIPGREAYYASLEHFLEDIPTILPRRHYDFLVAQNFMHEEFVAEDRPKVWFSREPVACLTEQTRKNLARVGPAPFIVSFAEEDIGRRMFYVALPSRRQSILRSLKRSQTTRRPGLCCIVNRYKENDQLPLLRERVRFVAAMGADIDIYGRASRYSPNRWEHYPNYRGAARDKLRTLARYTFNLCFENSDADGYITEKIIQALMAGCIPLYWGGGRHLAQTVPAACFINCRDQDPAGIHQRIRTMPQEEIVAYRQAGLEFMASGEADRFSWRHWAQTVARRLQEAKGTRKKGTEQIMRT